MAHIFVAIFLIVFGINILLGVVLPSWLIGLLALIAGLLLLGERLGLFARKP